MAEKNNSIGRLIITLTVIGALGALFLAGVYEWTIPHILEHEARARERAIMEVLPEADYYEEVTHNDQIFYEGYDENDNFVGVAVSLRGGGYAGEIEIMIGTDPEAREIINIFILNHQETPGLGARITEEQFRENFENAPFSELEIVRRTPEEPQEIEAIAGATMSVEAVKNIVSRVGDIVSEYYGGGS